MIAPEGFVCCNRRQKITLMKTSRLLGIGALLIILAACTWSLLQRPSPKGASADQLSASENRDVSIEAMPPVSGQSSSASASVSKVLPQASLIQDSGAVQITKAPSNDLSQAPAAGQISAGRKPSASYPAFGEMKLSLLSQKRDLSDPKQRQELAAKLKALEDAEISTAQERAHQMGLPIKGPNFTLVGFDGDIPRYQKAENANAAISTAAHQVRSTAPFNVDGSGWKIGMWEVGGIPRLAHQEFRVSSKITVRDGSTTATDHATHVAGTLIALGVVPSAKGMAPGMKMDAYSATNDESEMVAAGAAYGGEPDKIYVSNHSYGYLRGWEDGDTWWGTYTNNGDPSDDFDAMFGAYNTQSASLDTLVAALPYYLPVASSGNQRNDSAPSPGQTWRSIYSSDVYSYSPTQHPLGDGVYKAGYDTMDQTKTCKNILTVGAVNDAVSGTTRNPSLGTISNFSSTGPTDDGRIKPDIVGNGVNLYSAVTSSDTAYANFSGTSMSGPNVAGSAMLLVDYYGKRFPGQYMRASTLKALIIHTADDIGNPGPDYFYGWGLMDTKEAADQIKRHADKESYRGILEDTLTVAASSSMQSFTWNGTDPIRVTLCWTDPAGATSSANDNRTRDLVNDLNLTVTGPTGTIHRPFVMPYVGNWSNAMLSANATTGVNTVDNVEQVLIAAPPAAGLYTVTVNHTGSLSGGQQTYSLIISGQATDDLEVNDKEHFIASGFQGGPISPTSRDYTLSNTGAPGTLNWTASSNVAWLTASPTSGSLNAGTSATVTAQLTSAINDLPVGAHTAQLTLTNTSTGFVTTRRVTVNALAHVSPSILSPPQALTVNEGQSASFSVTATGGGLTYQWQKATTNIPGETASTYTIPATTAASAGSYRCVVSNSVGSFTTVAAVLTVISPPIITQHPVAQTVAAGTNVTFSINATGLNLSYQWQRNGVSIPLQVSSSLTLNSVTTAHIADYRCVVTNPSGQAISDPAALFVNGAPTITLHPLAVSAATGGTARFEVQALGPNLAYQWQFGGENIPSATERVLFIDPVSAGSVGSYRCFVSNTFGNAVSQSALLEIVTTPVLIAPTTPSTLNLKLNQTANFSASASGRSLTFQWQKDGENLGAPNSPTLIRPNLQAVDAGIYRCRIFNAAGEVFTEPVTLNVLLPPVITAHPVAQTVELSTSVSMSVTATGATQYQWLLNGSPITGATAATYNIASVSIIHLGNYSCEVTNAGGSVRSERALLAIEGMPIITRAPFPVLAEIGGPLRMDMEVVGDDLSYAWKRGSTVLSNAVIFDAGNMTRALVGSYVGQVGNSIQTVSSAPVPVTLISDLSPALDAATIKWSTSGHNFWRPVTTASQTKDGKDALVSSPMQNNQKGILSARLTGPLLLKWWQKTSSEAGKDELITYFDGEEITSLSGESDWEEEQLSVPPGEHLIEFVYAKDSAVSSGLDRAWLDGFVIAPDYAPAGVAEDRLAQSGTEVTLEAEFTGEPQTFQWRFNGKAIRGATQATLTLRNISSTQAGVYDCLLGAVGNGVRMSQISSPVQLGVVDAVNRTFKVKGGGKVAFSVSAKGKNLTYKWRQGSRELRGETEPKLERTFLQTFDSGDYICEVSNAGGTVAAGVNTLHVYDAVPQITLTDVMDPAIVSGYYSYQVPYNLDSSRVPTLWKSTKLPAGLKLNALTGEITGIPTTPTSTPYPIRITAMNGMDKVGHTVDTTLTIYDLDRKIGSFIGILPPDSFLNQNLGGRLDLTVTGSGGFSGSLTLGATKHSFSGRLTASLNHRDLAFANVTIRRGKLPPLALEFTVDDTELLTSASLNDGTNSILFSGWRNSWGTTSTTDALVGTDAPRGVYHFGMDIASEWIGSTTKPQGTSFGTISINATSGIASTAGRLADNTSYLTSGFAGKNGQIPLFTMPYVKSVRGSIVGAPVISIATDVHDNRLTGEAHWWRTVSTSKTERIYKNGFEAPLKLSVEGSRYVAPVAPNLILGLTEGVTHSLDLIFQQGGISASLPVPDINVQLDAGNVIVPPEAAANPRNTSLTINAAKGSFSGRFTLVDTDPLDLRPPPAVLRTLTRQVSYQGLLFRDALGWKGAGFFMLPELPDAAGETLSNTPTQSGQVLLLPPEDSESE